VQACCPAIPQSTLSLSVKPTRHSPPRFYTGAPAQALTPMAPGQPPSFPRCSLLFIQPAGYSAVSNTHPEVAERSGAVFSAAVREVLAIFSAYECQEYGEIGGIRSRGPGRRAGCRVPVVCRAYRHGWYGQGRVPGSIATHLQADPARRWALLCAAARCTCAGQCLWHMSPERLNDGLRLPHTCAPPPPTTTHPIWTENTFMVACHGPRVAAEVALALHSWLLDADWWVLPRELLPTVAMMWRKS
jgi:hypothetical protein